MHHGSTYYAASHAASLTAASLTAGCQNETTTSPSVSFPPFPEFPAPPVLSRPALPDPFETPFGPPSDIDDGRRGLLVAGVLAVVFLLTVAGLGGYLYVQTYL